MTESQAGLLSAKRILVSLDASAQGRAALDAAVRLAINTSAELHGLYVEDEDLVRLASLPFACEVELTSACTRKLESTSMERELRVAAQRAQQAFVNATRPLNLRWTFRVVRGTVSQASLAAADDVDLLIIGHQGLCWRRLTGDYLPRQGATGNRVVAVFDGTASAFRAIELANHLAESTSSDLAVLILGANGDQIVRQCLQWLQQQGIRAEINQAAGASGQAVSDYVQQRSPGILVVNRDSEVIGKSQISRLINEFDCPLILC